MFCSIHIVKIKHHLAPYNTSFNKKGIILDFYTENNITPPKVLSYTDTAPSQNNTHKVKSITDSVISFKNSIFFSLLIVII